VDDFQLGVEYKLWRLSQIVKQFFLTKKKILKVRHKIKRALMDEVKKWIGRKIKKPTVFV
jgi:hypothetical protein